MRARGWTALLAVAGMVIAGRAEAKTLVFCSEGSPEGLNPAFFTTSTTSDATRPIFNRLMDFERGSTKVIPGLAESWSLSDDGLTFTFKLRKGVKWHSSKTFTPTRDFNADDVIFTLERAWKPEHPFHKVSGAKYMYFTSLGMGTLLRSIKKLDDHTVAFELSRPEAPFLANLAMDFASIQSKEYADTMMKAGTPEKLDLEPIGTGPFSLVSYQKDAVIRYKANPNYWEGKAKIDDLVFSITPDASVRWAKIKAGECDVMAFPNPADLEAMRTDSRVSLLSQEGLNIGYWGFNTTRKPFDDKRVRQAMNYAVNKQAIVDAIYQGAGKAAKNPIPPSMWSYNDGVKDYPYDPEKARALLTDAGLAGGFETDIWSMPVQRPYNPNARRMAEMIQADLSKIGVKASIVTYEWAEYLKRARAGEHQTILLGWSSNNGDPDDFLNTTLGCAAAKNGTNRALWCFQPYDDLMQQARQTADVSTRTELYKKAQVIFKDEAPWLPIAFSVMYEPVRKQVVDYRVDPKGSHKFYGVDIKE